MSFGSQPHVVPGKSVWTCCLLTVLSMALAACGQASAMDIPGEAVGMSRSGKQVGKPPGMAAKSSGVVAKVPLGRESQKSLAKGQTSGKGKEQRNPLAKKRASAPRKASTGKRTTPIHPGMNNETQALHAEACKTRIEATLQPARIVQLAEACETELSNDILIGEFRQIATDARRVLEVQRSAGLSADLFTHPEGDADFRALVRLAVRGDRQASYRIAQAYRVGQSGAPANSRRMEQWLRFSAELGDGRASWELAEHYNYGGLIADAAKYEKKAEDLGYRPAVRLPSRGY